MQLKYPKKSWLVQPSVTPVALNRDNIINETQRNNYHMTDVLVLVMVLMGYHHLCYPQPYPLPGFLATTLPSRSKNIARIAKAVQCHN